MENFVIHIMYAVVVCIAYETTICTAFECDDGYSVLLQNGNTTCKQCDEGCSDCTYYLLENNSSFTNCTSCSDGYYLDEDNTYETVICKKCKEICKTCDSYGSCTRCADGYGFYLGGDCITTCTCRNALINAGVILGIITLVMPLIYGIYRMIQQSRKIQQPYPRRTIPPIEESIPLSSSVQINESEQEATGDSMEPTLQNKDEGRYIRRHRNNILSVKVPLLCNVRNDKSEQEIKADSLEMKNENRDTAPISSIVIPNMVQHNESEQETGGESGDSTEVNVQNNDGETKPVESNKISHNVQINESEEETGGDLGDSAEVKVQNNDEETYIVPIGGSMSYYPEKLLGKGSFGVVYEGRSGVHQNKPVAVKKVVCMNDQEAKELLHINKEIRTLETLDTIAENTHIIRFIDSYIKKNTVYLAFELAIGTLVDYVSPLNASWRMSLTGDFVIRGIVAGLNYTHKKSILHRDLKPGNIFIVEYSVSGLKAVIGDFGQSKAMTGNTLTSTGNFGSFGYIAPEIWKAMSDTETLSLGTKCNKASDIFSLGLVAYYAISLGKHPFGNTMTAQVSISNGNLPTFEKISFAYEDMFECMLNNNPDDRPSMEVVSEHPALWQSDKVIKYFGKKSDEFESQIKTGINDQLLEDPSLITEPGGIWMNLLPVNLKTYLRNYRLNLRSPLLYKGKKSSIRYFLRAIRNTTAHYKNDYPTNTHAELGPFPDGHVELWLTVCPKLLMHVYTKLGPP